MKALVSVFLFSVCGAVVLNVQNNFEKKKREIANKINALTDEVLEEVEKGEAEKKLQNLVKRKREIVDAINTLTEEALDIAKRVDDFGKKKKEIADTINALAEDVLDVEKQDEALQIVKRAAESQVHNFERKKRDVLVELLREKRQNTNPQGFNFGLVQDCKGGNCRQKNAGGFGNVQRCQGAGCEQANTGGFGHVQDCGGSHCGQLNRGKREEAVHTLTCAGDVTSMCTGKDCVVSCSDGGQISLVCEDEIVDVNSDSDSGNVDARCGSAKEIEEKIQAFRSLFPF